MSSRARSLLKRLRTKKQEEEGDNPIETKEETKTDNSLQLPVLRAQGKSSRSVPKDIKNKEEIDPLDYFKTTVSVSEPEAVPYPVSKYAFNLMIPIDDATYSIVKQDFDKVSDRVNYIFDIDVLKRSNLVFEIGTIMTVLSELRTIKNNLFFGNVTTKLIEACN